MHGIYVHMDMCIYHLPSPNYQYVSYVVIYHLLSPTHYLYVCCMYVCMYARLHVLVTF